MSATPTVNSQHTSLSMDIVVIARPTTTVTTPQFVMETPAPQPKAREESAKVKRLEDVALGLPIAILCLSVLYIISFFMVSSKEMKESDLGVPQQ